MSAKLVNDFLAVNFFCERNLSQKLDWVLNMPLILSSNVICVVFIATLPQHIHTMVTLVPYLFQLVLRDHCH